MENSIIVVSACENNTGESGSQAPYTHVLDKGVSRTASPLDFLDEVTAEEMQGAVAATRGLVG